MHIYIISFLEPVLFFKPVYFSNQAGFSCRSLDLGSNGHCASCFIVFYFIFLLFFVRCALLSLLTVLPRSLSLLIQIWWLWYDPLDLNLSLLINQTVQIRSGFEPNCLFSFLYNFTNYTPALHTAPLLI